MKSVCRMFRLPSVFLLLWIGTLLHIAAADKGDLCYVSGEKRVALIGTRLYFMGNYYSFDGGDQNQQEQSLYWLDLTESFSTSGPLPSDNIHSIDAPDNSPWRNDGVFFYNNDTLYMFAGLGTDASPTNTMWSYNATADAWNEIAVSGGAYNWRTRSNSFFASDPASGTSWIFGGREPDPWNGADLTGGMVTFDSSEKLPSWQNETNGSPEGFEGKLVYTRLGERGVLVAVGGWDTSNYLGDQGIFQGYGYRSLAEIDVYDIESSTWYTVEATGDVPTNRTGFCISVSAAPDDSSFNIYLYGGKELASNTYYEEVWVLSLPSFRWIKTDATYNSEADSGDATGRVYHQCMSYNDRTMLVVGGEVSTGGEGYANVDSCSDSYPPIRVLDTSTLSWKEKYDPEVASNAYTVPEAIYEVIGGDASGKAAVTAPEKGWDNQELSILFAKTVPKVAESTVKYDSATAPTTSTNSSAPATTTTTTTSVPSATSTAQKGGVIAGGVIGAFAGVSLAVIGFLFYIYRRKPNTWSRFRVRVFGAPKVDEHAGKPELSQDAVVTKPSPTLGYGPGQRPRSAQKWQAYYEMDAMEKEISAELEVPDNRMPRMEKVYSYM